MSSLEPIRIKKILPGPDACFVSTEHEERQIEYHFIVHLDGRVFGKTRQNRWVAMSHETTGLIRNKIRQYVANGLKS